jgi:tRNA-dihydrouridine synthase A
MLGRAAYQTPYLLAAVDATFFADPRPVPSRAETMERLLPYAARHMANGGRLNNVARHVLGLYHGRPRGRLFRRHLAEHAVREGATVEVLRDAMAIAEGVVPGLEAEAAE